MREDSYIILNDPIIKGESLRFSIGFSKDIRKYLFSNNFYVKYGKNIDNIQNSILNIPGVSSLYTLALITGANLLVEELDMDYFYSLKHFEKVLNKFFPDLHFKGKLTVKKLVKNDAKNIGNALMFSGGVDSMHLYTKIRNIKPDLYTIIGGTIPVTNKDLIKRFKINLESFAKKEGVDINFIEINLGQVLNEGLLTAKYGRNFPQTDATWWGKLNHGIVQISACAPLTIRENIGKIYVAASSRPYPDGTHSSLVDKIFWSGARAVPDIDGNKRFEKVKAILEMFSMDTSILKFQTCLYSPVNTNLLNCGSCSKCLSLIVSLMILGYDPRSHSLPIIKNIKKHLEKNTLPNLTTANGWIRIKEGIEEESEKIRNEFRDLIYWLKDYELNLSLKMKPDYGQRVKCGAMKLSTRLPRSIQDTVMKIYYRFKYVKEIESLDFHSA